MKKKTLKKKQVEIIEDKPLTLSSLKAYCDYRCVAPRTGRHWRQLGLPINQDGTIDRIEADAWYKVNIEDKKRRKDGKDWSAEYRKVKYEMAFLELEERCGRLIKKEEVVQDLRKGILTMKQQFLALPKQIIPQLNAADPVEAEAMLYEKICEVIDMLANGSYFE